MSYSPNNRNKSVSNKIFDKNKQQKNLIHKKYSPNHTNNNNLKLITTNDTNSTKNSNKKDPIINDKEISFNSVPIKPKNELEDNLEKMFIKKKLKTFKPPTTTNKKIITFQRQKDKEILEFFLFDDDLIFKDINRSYLQDEHVDDGDRNWNNQLMIYMKI